MDIKKEIQEVYEKIDFLYKSLDINNKKARLEFLNEETTRENFWNNKDESAKVVEEMNTLKKEIEFTLNVKSRIDNVRELFEEYGEEAEDEVLKELDSLKSEVEKLEMETMFDGVYDNSNAYMEIHSGAGGTESCDWVAMLLRMYSKWAERRGWTFEILDILDGEEAGVKSVTFQINGENAFGYARSEKGVHRLVRISPFDSGGRRHTSFASCDVMPELNDDVGMDINSEDLRIDTYRAGGAGGQHVNKTESAVRITHLPTNTVVQCQNERSQLQNRDRAMKMLKAKLHILHREEQLSKLESIRGETKDIAWGSQIRSYVFHPYNMVKDHRTDEETGNVQAVMDGNLDAFSNSYLVWLTKS